MMVELLTFSIKVSVEIVSQLLLVVLINHAKHVDKDLLDPG